ncbi:MAG: sigma-70 family RNA polymerase sigma factor [Planctomyces sp.]|nr:sigma-70 family RNA polymerase sigma factor [Planctomyces sp.]
MELTGGDNVQNHQRAPMIPSPPETRASLIVRLRDAADVVAWDEFVSVYGPLVYRLALRQGLQSADADDVVQQVFAAVAQSVHHWLERPDRGRFRGWLLTISRNIAIKTLTRRPCGGIGFGGDPGPAPLSELAEPSPDVCGQFDIEYRREVYRWAAEQVRASVAPKTWNAFQLTHIEGVSIADAAARLNLSAGNVYIARSRVISRLRELARQFEVSE